MAFFGAVVKPGKPTPQVPHPDEGVNLHLSQACLPATTPKGKRVSLFVNHEDEDPVAIATLVAGQMDSVPLDLFFSEYVEWTLQGDAVDVHISGYYSPAFEGHEDGVPMGYGEEDEDEDGEDEDGIMGMGEDDSEDEDGDGEFEEMGEDDEDGEEEDEEDDVPAGFGRKPKVVIEEVTEEEEPKTKKRPAEQPQQQQASKKQQQQQQKEEKKAEEKKVEEKKDGKKDAKKEQQQKKEEKKEVQASPADNGKAGEVKTAKKNVRKWENGFEIEEVQLGPANGKLAKSGKRVVVHYTGRLKSNGKVFDKSGNKPFSFRLGVGEVIKGWDLGVEGMRVGDKRRLVIPAQLAYGSSGVKGTIPGNATLEFDVQLVDVK